MYMAIGAVVGTVVHKFGSNLMRFVFTADDEKKGRDAYKIVCECGVQIGHMDDEEIRKHRDGICI